MLYDKRWEKTEVKADPLSLENLIAWLEKQPASRTYNYNNCEGACLYGLYMADHGVDWESSGAVGERLSSPEHFKFCCFVYQNVASKFPWSFGAALDRARSALSIG